MKIIVRLPTRTYAYQEVHFDTLDEYKKMMPEYAKAYLDLKIELEKISAEHEKSQPPF